MVIMDDYNLKEKKRIHGKEDKYWIDILTVLWRETCHWRHLWYLMKWFYQVVYCCWGSWPHLEAQVTMSGFLNKLCCRRIDQIQYISKLNTKQYITKFLINQLNRVFENHFKHIIFRNRSSIWQSEKNIHWFLSQRRLL